MSNEVEFDTKGGRMRGEVLRINGKTVLVQILSTKPRPIYEVRQLLPGLKPRSQLVGWDKSEHPKVIKRHWMKHNVKGAA